MTFNEELVSYWAAKVKDAAKQARAEVLAACVAETKKFSTDEAVSLGCRRVVEAVEYQIRQLQPAAKALEELLEKAREEARRKEREEFFEGHQPQPMFDGGCYLACSCGWAHGDSLDDGESGSVQDWIRHIEKARAILEGK